jgi:hypothetical protein
MDDLLKDAIADAKAVRETALENAKIALEEAFTPRLQSMLSKKIQSEIEVDEGEHEDDEDVEERMDDEDDVEERAKKIARDGDEIEDEGEERGEDEKDEGIIEIDGVKYAPVVSEEDDEDEVEEGEERGEDDDVDEDLDLDEILKELDEEGVNEEEEIDEIEEVDEDVDEIEENDVSSGIGKGDNSHDKKSGDSTDIGKAGKAKFESVEAISEEEDEDKKDESVEEDIDLEEIVKALSEEEDDEEEKNEVAELQSELDEHRNVVKYLRSKLNEVNLLNAKLLFTNKLFRSYGLNNDQKMKVVETFDRAHNLREVKLVYSTLAESFGSKQTKTEIKESKGSASKPVASTKSEKQEVISEGHELRDRFKKLAGIL